MVQMQRSVLLAILFIVLLGTVGLSRPSQAELVEPAMTLVGPLSEQFGVPADAVTGLLESGISLAQLKQPAPPNPGLFGTGFLESWTRTFSLGLSGQEGDSKTLDIIAALDADSENTNRLLRQYFPKGTDLSGYSQADLNRVALQLNQRPRKTLAFHPPAEVLNDNVALTG